MEKFQQIMQNPWVTLTALVATVLGLLYAIWSNYKQRKYPTRLSYYSYRTINLYKSLSIPFSKLKITYDEKEIDTNIMYLSGFLICEGIRDITNNTESLHINLPKGYRWLDIDVSSPIDDLNKELKIDFQENKATLKFAKFKRGEGIFIQSVVKSAKGEYATHERISFSHRIDNTDQKVKMKINSAFTSGQKILSANFIKLFYGLAVFFVLGVISFICLCFSKGSLVSNLNVFIIPILSFILLSWLCFQQANQSRRIRKLRSITNIDS